MSETLAAEAAPSWEPGGTLLDSIVIERRLGRGGMGEVFLARDTLTGERFAVKTVLAESLADDRARRLFFRELQTWVDLPEHPHLVNCRFFRTVGDRLAVFAEFVDGDSLQRAIEEQRLASLDAVLDVAIQAAWGLQAAHDAGVVHQDIKPSNILVGSDGLALISDFGLSRAQHFLLPEGLASGDGLVTSAGMTLAYCSPEQAAGQLLSSKTDMWSYGLAVLAMFAGKTPCRVGIEAPFMLANVRTDASRPITSARDLAAREDRSPSVPRGEPLPATDVFTRAGPVTTVTSVPVALPAALGVEAENPASLELPAEVARVLERCFLKDPGERWASMGEVAERLREAFQSLLGRPYPRRAPEVMLPRGRGRTLERLVLGSSWEDPRAWLVRIGKIEGRPDEPGPAPTPGSQQALVIEDLALYDEAERRLVRLVEGNEELERVLAELYIARSLVHIAADDPPGELACTEKAVALLERLVFRRGRSDLAATLADAYLSRGDALSGYEEPETYARSYDQALSIVEKYLDRDDQDGLLAAQARALVSKAMTLREMDGLQEALSLGDQAVASLTRLAARRSDLRRDLFFAIYSQGVTLASLDEPERALVCFGEALALLDEILAERRQSDLIGDRAEIRREQARVVAAQGGSEAAALYDQVIADMKFLVLDDGRRNWLTSLLDAFIEKADVLRDAGDTRGAHGALDEAISLGETMAREQGQFDISDPLAALHARKGNVSCDEEDWHEAERSFDRAIKIYEPLVQRGQGALAIHLGSALADKGNALWGRGDFHGAAGLYRKAIEIYERLAPEDHDSLLRDLASTRADLAGSLAALGQFEAALGLYDQAVALREQLVAGDEVALEDLIDCKIDRALLLADAGQKPRARAEAKEIVAALKAEVESSGRDETRQFLKEARRALSGLLRG